MNKIRQKVEIFSTKGKGEIKEKKVNIKSKLGNWLKRLSLICLIEVAIIMTFLLFLLLYLAIIRAFSKGDVFSSDILDKFEKNTLLEYDTLERKEEIESIFDLIKKEDKKHIFIHGEKGVGKTHLSNEIANSIFKGEGPKELYLNKKDPKENFTILRIDMKYSHWKKTAELIKDSWYKKKKEKNLMIIFDNMCPIFEPIPGSNFSVEVSFANVFGNFLKMKELIFVLVSDNENLYKIKKKDEKFFNNDFNYVEVKPLSEESTNVLLEKKSYKKYNDIKISKKDIEEITSLSNRYIEDEKIPNSALKNLDEVISRAKGKEINSSNIKDFFINCYNVSPLFIQGNNDETAFELEEKMKVKLKGQDQAIKKICDKLISVQSDFGSREGPLASFLFVGPTGVGKTKASLFISEVFTGKEENIIRLDMSAYNTSHSLSDLIGSPVGYQGHQEEPYLSRQMGNKKSHIILVDEAEKAHDEVINIFLSALDTGTIKMANGKVLNFKESIFIFTSNVGALLYDNIGADEYKVRQKEIEETIHRELCHRFKPEVVGRFSEIVYFRNLEENAIREIAKKEMDDFIHSIKIKHNIDNVTHLDSIIQLIFENGTRGGARTIKNFIKNEIISSFSKTCFNAKKKYKEEKGHSTNDISKEVLKIKEVIFSTTNDDAHQSNPDDDMRFVFSSTYENSVVVKIVFFNSKV